MGEMQAPHLLALGRRQAILAPTQVAVGLADPVAREITDPPFQMQIPG